MPLALKEIAKNTINKTGTFLLSPPYGGMGQIINHGPRDVRKVAITFDDGPSRPCTEALLDTMGELDVKGTFFCVGVNTRWHPDLLARAFAEGHIIGNHSMQHSRKAGIKFSGAAHIEDAEKEIVQVIKKRPLLYRPPWGWLTPWEAGRLHNRGYTIVGWDIYTRDWMWPEPDGKIVAEEGMAKVKPGSIFLFHDANAGVEIWDKKQTALAIRHLVPALRREGYEIVTVPELLNVPAYAE
jgi:peptidoglycan/xylan/chitin deacetylase (PgdA/CDA1 family)